MAEGLSLQRVRAKTAEEPSSEDNLRDAWKRTMGRWR